MEEWDDLSRCFHGGADDAQTAHTLNHALLLLLSERDEVLKFTVLKFLQENCSRIFNGGHR
jgi:hypothetical protein